MNFELFVLNQSENFNALEISSYTKKGNRKYTVRILMLKRVYRVLTAALFDDAEKECIAVIDGAEVACPQRLNRAETLLLSQFP